MSNLVIDLLTNVRDAMMMVITTLTIVEMTIAMTQEEETETTILVSQHQRRHGVQVAVITITTMPLLTSGAAIQMTSLCSKLRAIQITTHGAHLLNKTFFQHKQITMHGVHHLNNKVTHLLILMVLDGVTLITLQTIINGEDAYL